MRINHQRPFRSARHYLEESEVGLSGDYNVTVVYTVLEKRCTRLSFIRCVGTDVTA